MNTKVTIYQCVTVCTESRNSSKSLSGSDLLRVLFWWRALKGKDSAPQSMCVCVSSSWQTYNFHTFLKKTPHLSVCLLFFSTYICTELNFPCVCLCLPLSLLRWEQLELSRPLRPSAQWEKPRVENTNGFWTSERDEGAVNRSHDRKRRGCGVAGPVLCSPGVSQTFETILTRVAKWAKPEQNDRKAAGTFSLAWLTCIWSQRG